MTNISTRIPNTNKVPASGDLDTENLLQKFGILPITTNSSSNSSSSSSLLGLLSSNNLSLPVSATDTGQAVSQKLLSGGMEVMMLLLLLLMMMMMMMLKVTLIALYTCICVTGLISNIALIYTILGQCFTSKFSPFFPCYFHVSNSIQFTMKSRLGL